jgi:hypothetical protein
MQVDEPYHDYLIDDNNRLKQFKILIKRAAAVIVAAGNRDDS